MKDLDWLIESKLLEPVSPIGNWVLLHGFGGSPFDMKPLAEALFQSGHRVVVPLIPGQSRMFNSESKWVAQDLIDHTEQIITAESQRGLPFYMGGFSMGGAISIIHGQRINPKGLILLAPYLRLYKGQKILEMTGPVLARFFPPIPKLSSGRIASPKGQKEYHCGASWLSVPAIFELNVIADIAKESALGLSCPTLWCHSVNDPVADYAEAEKRLLPHAVPLSLNRSQHVLLYDWEAEEVIQHSLSFIEL